MSTYTSLGLAVGLSLGVFFGIILDTIGAGMMFGVIIGLCSDSVVSSFYCYEKNTQEKNQGK